MEVLLAVPIQLRTPAQWARLRELISASSQARRRKRKKRRKKRLPKSSARHPLPSGIRTRKSGHCSTSPSFWQSPVLCPGVAWFNSGYSPCVSSQRLWFSSSFSTCWTRILRSFLNLDILLLAPVIWQPLVRCLPCPGYTEKLDFLREDFSHYFLRAPCIWQSHYCVWCCIWSFGLWIFQEMTPGMVSVLNTPTFDSGHFGVSLRCLLEEFPSYFNAMLGSTGDTSLCVRLRRLVFSGYDAPRAVFLRCPQAPDACHHGRYGPERMLCVAVQKTADSPQLQFLAGRAVHPVVAQWQCLTVQTVGPRDTVIDVPVVQDERVPHVPSWRRPSCSHGCTVVAFVLRSSSSTR